MKQTFVTLARVWDESIDPTNWWISEKLDGIRCVWDGINLVSRNNKPIIAPREWLDKLPIPNKPIDGELYCGRGKFQECVSIVRKKEPISWEWNKVTLMAFDVIDTQRTWIERFRVKPTLNCQPLPHYLCHSYEQLYSMYDSIVEQGGEGLMLRHPSKYYEFCRSKWLLKVKPELTLECGVIGHTSGEGKYLGMVGALECAFTNAEGKAIEFNVGSGLTDNDRLHPPAVGSKIKIRYQCLTDDGLPRFPRFDCRLI